MKQQVDKPELELFRNRLLSWFEEEARDLPWRKDKNPYLIWISEIMLQQTRVDQARPYYERFVLAFPDLASLAKASQDEVLKNWEGLGYYSRARNLHKAARLVVDDFDGELPRSTENLASLPGIGPYTTAAISSIAFNEPLAVVDGNVVRVLSRLFAIKDPVNRSVTRKNLETLASLLLDQARPGKFNEAMMELGATVCHPNSPRCHNCSVSDFCSALELGIQSELPNKDPKKKPPHHEISIGVIADPEGKYFIAKRPDNAMLGGLWEFPGGKREGEETLESCCKREIREELGIEVKVGEQIAIIKHAYSHFKITMHAFHCSIQKGSPKTKNGMPFLWATKEDLTDYAFPRANRKLIETLLEVELPSYKQK